MVSTLDLADELEDPEEGTSLCQRTCVHARQRVREFDREVLQHRKIIGDLNKQLQGQPGPQSPPLQVKSSDDDQQPPPQQWQQQEPDGSSSSGSLTSSSSSSEEENHQQEPQSEVHLMVSSDEEQPLQQQQPEQQTRGSAAAKRKLPFCMASPAEVTTSENKAAREIKSKKRLSVQPPQKKRAFGLAPTTIIMYVDQAISFTEYLRDIAPKYSRVSLQKITIVFKALKKLYRDIGRTVLGHQFLVKQNKEQRLVAKADLAKCQAFTPWTAVSTYNFETNDDEMRKNLSSFMCHSAQTHQRFYALHETVQRAKQMRDMFVLLIHPRPPPLLRPPTLLLRAE
ncbi:hypothetical protein ABVT39_015296 [Epinephelus coioides]